MSETISIANLPTQTQYEIHSLKLILAWEWNYKTIEEREEVIDRLKYSIGEVGITLLMNEQLH